LDALGREHSTEIQLGADYGNETLVVGRRAFDKLGRVDFEADATPKSQSNGTSYGTSYHYNIDGTPSCFIRGRGPQRDSEVVDESAERYPTCFIHEFAGNRALVSVVDPAHPLIRHQSAYDASGRVRSKYTLRMESRTGPVAALLEAMDLSYDPLGNPHHMGRLFDLGTQDWVNTFWKYDSLGQMLELAEPESAVQFRTYDNWGELTQVRWTDSTTLSSTDRRLISKYDALGRTVHTEDRTNNVVDAETVNDYLYDRPVNNTTPAVTATNVLGRLAKASSPTSTVAFSYDGLGRINTKVFTDTTASAPGNVYVEKQTFHGDDSLARVDLLLPDTAFQKNERVDYTYDSAGRARSVSYTDGTHTQQVFSASAGIAAIDYFGRIRQAQYGQTSFTASYADDGRRFINSLKVTSPAGSTGESSREISYPVPSGFDQAFDPLGRENGRRETRTVNGVASTGIDDVAGHELQLRHAG
jgi:hypothetical protein